MAKLVILSLLVLASSLVASAVSVEYCIKLHLTSQVVSEDSWQSPVEFDSIVHSTVVGKLAFFSDLMHLYNTTDKKANYAVSVSSVDIIPNPVISGELATFNISASTDKSITGGKMIIDVNYFFIHVDRETHDLCEGTSCPATGNFTMAHQRELPSYTPPGSYTITMKMQDSEGKLLTCIRFGFSIGLVADS